MYIFCRLIVRLLKAAARSNILFALKLLSKSFFYNFEPKYKLLNGTLKVP